eukprot:g26415.t1
MLTDVENRTSGTDVHRQTPDKTQAQENAPRRFWQTGWFQLVTVFLLLGSVSYVFASIVTVHDTSEPAQLQGRSGHYEKSSPNSKMSSPNSKKSSPDLKKSSPKSKKATKQRKSPSPSPSVCVQTDVKLTFPDGTRVSKGTNTLKMNNTNGYPFYVNEIDLTGFGDGTTTTCINTTVVPAFGTYSCDIRDPTWGYGYRSVTVTGTSCGQRVSITVTTFSKNCFLPGTLITMADGSFKVVEDVVYGDMVKGRYGPEKIIMTEPAYLGIRRLYSVNSRGGFITGDHPLLNGGMGGADRDRKLVLDIEELQENSPNNWTRTIVPGNTVLVWNNNTMSEMNETVITIDILEMDPYTKVYEIQPDGYGSVIANGVFVERAGVDWQLRPAAEIARLKIRQAIRPTAHQRYEAAVFGNYLSIALSGTIDPYTYFNAVETASFAKVQEFIASATVPPVTTEFDPAWLARAKADRTANGLTNSLNFSAEPRVLSPVYRLKYLATLMPDVFAYFNATVKGPGDKFIDGIENQLTDWWESMSRFTASIDFDHGNV